MESLGAGLDRFKEECLEMKQRMEAVVEDLKRQRALYSRPAAGALVAREQPPQDAWDGRLDRFERMLADTLSAVMVLRQDVTGLKQDVTGLKQDVTGLKQDVAGLKQDVTALKQDVTGLKQDVTALKQDVAGLKQDVAGLKQDVAGLKQDVAGLKQDVAGLKQDVAGLKQDVAGLKQDVAGLQGETGLIREQMATKVELESLRASVDLVADGFTETQNKLTRVADLLKRYLVS
jgi:chromosome segregation ATPase